MNIMEWILVIIASIHLVVCPFTKVEESFNLQAMHDLLYHRFNISQYDHLEFPGVVPRTFLGPIFVTVLSAPFIVINSVFGASKFLSQYVVRAVLGTTVIFAFQTYRLALEKEFGKVMTTWLILITASQFHFMYYLSRPLPNTFALILTLLAYGYWIRQKHLHLIVTTAAAVIIFRGEVAILLGFILLTELTARRLTIKDLLKYGISSGLVIWNTRLKSLFRVLLVLCVCFHLVFNLVTSGLLLYISYHNYPGGFALARLHQLEGDRTDVSVHIDVFTAQTGVSRFAQVNPFWK
ncbi:dol-P-Man:Man(7)GlcNAc(2)-PP-Dol alpha-1,6-mannosyltransferase-like isoform X3 [Limulus polyphemus]|uniref:Mannosyltransferase n=1 Tax=Limulus polyphemus TaxID=6850 RepID=A0ABM1S543_LIMPO|nr:dol-P-Man:Man(7)GlcNAc(2)-PP-Dol alpha-1,6-mannosyltransferase-like isoform X3 [Limulus polyphemus]